MAASDASFVFFAEHFNYSLVSAFDLKCSPVVIVKTSHKSKVVSSLKVSSYFFLNEIVYVRQK